MLIFDLGALTEECVGFIEEEDRPTPSQAAVPLGSKTAN